MTAFVVMTSVGGRSQTYLPLTGGTLTGNVFINGSGESSINLYSAYSGAPANPGLEIKNTTGILTFQHNSNGGSTNLSGHLTGTSATFNGVLTSGVKGYSINTPTFQLTNQSNVDGISGVAPTGAFRWYTNPNNSNKEGFLYQLRSFDTITGESNGLFTATGSGKVGIGTTPSDRLHVYTNDQHGEIRIGGGNGSGNGRIYIQADFASNNSYIDAYGDNAFKKLSIEASPLILNASSNGNVGIGTQTPGSLLTFKKNNAGVSIDPLGGDYCGALAFNREVATGAIFNPSKNAFQINNGGADANLHFQVYDGSGVQVTGNALVISGSSGYVGIGTATPTESLSVNGKIRAKEIKVELSGWQDYVFAAEHKLPSLREIESYIKINKHLPEIPSAEEVEENGISLGEMNAKLLQKIEELTLYVIEQHKRLDKQEKENQMLKDRVRRLEDE